MMILGPLVAPRTSTVTPALSRPVAVTVSPSTVITTGSVSVAPTAASVLSICLTSRTAPFCCLLPARTIAYTAVSFVGRNFWSAGPRSSAPDRERGRVVRTGRARLSAPRGHRTRRASRPAIRQSGPRADVRGNLSPPDPDHKDGPPAGGGPPTRGSRHVRIRLTTSHRRGKP